jgi:hypothetical protein
VDPRLTVVPVVVDFASAVEDHVEGLYVGGSVATGDYRPGISDIDAVALMDRSPTLATRNALIEIHQRLALRVDGGKVLHCVYVPRDSVADTSCDHWTWAFGELFRRPLSGIARAELLADPVVVSGPPPSSWLPAMDAEALRDAARAGLAGYWTSALQRPTVWLQDAYLDIGLTTLARADATIREARLITKQEATVRLTGLGVPTDVVDGIIRRRHGHATPLSDQERTDRASVVRHVLREGIARLLA